jgi:hypothetical protein
MIKLTISLQCCGSGKLFGRSGLGPRCYNVSKMKFSNIFDRKKNWSNLFAKMRSCLNNLLEVFKRKKYLIADLNPDPNQFA